MDDKPLTPEQKEEADQMLVSLNGYAVDLEAIREAIQTLGGTMDAQAIYSRLQAQRPTTWPALPSFEVLMGPEE